MEYTYRIMEFKFVKNRSRIDIFRYEVELLDSISINQIMNYDDFEYWCCRWFRENTIFSDKY